MKKAVFNYRPEIDGLRTLAVLLVMLFHAKLEIFSGGFIGVDVFFVISGFLITSIIYKENINNNFSYLSFYERRIRRIFPMIFFILFITSIISFFIYSPSQFKDFAQSVVSTISYSSNIYFYNKIGYFSGNLNNSPLIHTWSLAVEEQFYLFFPVILTFFYKYKEKQLKLIIIILIVLSFSSIFIFKSSGEFNFFMATSRVWELLIGSYLAVNRKNLFSTVPLSRNKYDFFSILGIVMIFWSAIYFDYSTFHPGPLTFIPVIGTALVIKYANRNNIVGIILSNKIVVYLGLVSYSAYLIHQPLFVFTAQIFNMELPFYVYLLLIVITFILSHFAYKFVESPFRNKKLITRNMVFKGSFIISLIFLSFGLYGHFSNGIQNRFSNRQIKIFNEIEISPLRNYCHTEGVDYLKPSESCNPSSFTPSWAVLGDSHGVEISYMLNDLLKSYNKSSIQLTFSGCPPAFGFDSNNPGCSDWNTDAVNYLINNKNIQNVVLVYRHSYYLKGENKTTFPETELSPLDFINSLDNLSDLKKKDLYFEGLNNIIDKLISNNKTVYLVYPIPEIIDPIDKYIFNNYFLGSPMIKKQGPSFEYYKKRNNYFLAFIGKTNNNKLVKIPTFHLFSKNNSIEVIKEGKALYFDSNHPSLFGANLVSKLILKLSNEKLD